MSLQRLVMDIDWTDLANINRVLAAGLPAVVIHEAAFLLERENPDVAWKILKTLKE